MRRGTDIPREALGWAGNYVQVRAYMVRDLRLSGRALMAFAIIHGFASKSGACTSTLAYFSWWLGCSERSCSSAIRRLEDAGLVTVERRRDASGARRCVYRLTERGARPPRRDVPDGAWDPEDDTLVLTGWMVSSLGLSGRDLLAYAAIFERTQDGGECAMPHSLLAAWMGSSPQTVRSCARRLEALGLVAGRVCPDERGVPQSLYRLGPVRAKVEATVAEIQDEAPATAPGPEAVGAETPAADRFAELKSHVLTTRNFRYGREAYERLLAMGVTHDEVVRRLDGVRHRFQADHPGREERYLPQCHRLLDDVIVAVEDERVGTRRARAAREDDASTLARAANLPGPLGTEAFRLLEESQRAAARGDSGRSAELDAERRAWCERHRDEVWGHCGPATAGAAGA